MATLVVPGGLQTVRYGTGGPFYDVYDAEANNAQFLADYLGYVASPSDAEAYPISFYGANPFIWNGGTIKGNIPAGVDWSTWYLSSANDFNSACIFPRGNINGTINRVTIGERDNLDSFPADGIRANQAGTLTVNNLTVWGCRDDLFESDGNQETLFVNDIYAENLFVFMSATGNIPTSQRRITRGLLHFRRWPYRGANEYGLLLKTDNAAASPNFFFEDVVVAVGTDTFGDDGDRLTGGLANTTCTGECRILVLGGFLQSNTIRTAYQNAGFVVVEDGNGSAATNEYLARKAAWLGETGGGGGGSNPDPAAPPFDGFVRTRVICSSGFFTPKQDTQILGWFASDDPATIEDVANAVSAWRKKRGEPTEELTQAAPASQLSTNTRTNNFRNALDSDAGDFLSGTIAIPSNGNYAVHFAAIVDTVSNQYQSIVGMNTAWQLEAGSASQFLGFLRTGGADNLTLTGGPYNGLVIGSIVFDKTMNSIKVFINGVERASGPYSETHNVSQSLKVLTNRAQNQFLDGAILDVIVTADITKTTQYQAYLSAKHAVV